MLKHILLPTDGSELVASAMPRATGLAKSLHAIMVSHARRGLSGLLSGRETVKVLTHSRISVLVVR